MDLKTSEKYEPENAWNHPGDLATVGRVWSDSVRPPLAIPARKLIMSHARSIRAREGCEG